MDLKIGVIISLIVGCILVAAVLPTALTLFYKEKSDVSGHVYGYDAYGKAIATDVNTTNDAATSAIYKLFPLFAALGGMTLVIGVGLKEFGAI